MSKVTGNIGTKSFNANTSITIESSKEKTNKNKSRSAAISECFLNHNYFPDDPEFTKIIRQVEDAIEAGVYPELIAQGSSGSYFAKNGKGVKNCITSAKDTIVHTVTDIRGISGKRGRL